MGFTLHLSGEMLVADTYGHRGTEALETSNYISSCEIPALWMGSVTLAMQLDVAAAGSAAT